MLIKVFNMFYRIRNKEKGSLTIEATIILPLVIMTLLFLANILNICMVNLCMQQALNNTAKKISQHSYIIYRIAGEKNYQEFINTLGSIDSGYDNFKSKGEEVVSNVDKLQTDVGNTIQSFNDVTTALSVEGSFLEKLKNLGDKSKNLITSIKTTIDDAGVFVDSLGTLIESGKQNIKSITIRLLVDTSTGIAVSGVSKYIFDNYVTELSVPASKISEVSAFHSTLDPSGCFSMVVSYVYNNPFSFGNSQNASKSIFNKKIRMTNVVTIRPFIGNNGTSLVKDKTEENKSEAGKTENNINEKQIEVYISERDYGKDENGKIKKKYHKVGDCRNLQYSQKISLEEAKKITGGPCSNCKPDADYKTHVDAKSGESSGSR